MNKLVRSIDKINICTVFLAGFALLAMVVQVSLDVICKYLINSPIPSTLETVSSYYMIALVFLPLGVVTRDQEHINVELFTQGLGKRKLAFFNIFAGILAIVYVVCLVFYSAEEAIYMTSIRESWETALLDMEIWPARWFVTVGCFMMLLYLIIQTAAEVRFLITHKDADAPAKDHGNLDLDL